MRFAHPKMLWLLAITVLLMSIFFAWSWRRRRFLISQFVQSRLLAHLTVGLSKPAQKLRMVLIVAATGLVILTLARPQWGFAWEEVHQRGLDIIIAIDTSRSMLAEDISPNRLQRAKLGALDLMRLARRDRIGLVAFAGTAFLQCPLTLDDEAFRQSLNQLDIGIIPQGGTALAEAIQTAQAAYKERDDSHRVLVLFTDGEDHDSGAVEAAEKAAQAGVRIFTVGVGTPNGELLKQRDAQGTSNYVKDQEGNVVKSRLNEALLTKIATAANGFYLPMLGASAMDVLYQRGLEPLPRGEIASKMTKQYYERFQWPLSIAVILLLIEVFLPERRKVVKTEAILAAANPGLKKLVAMLLLAFVVGRAGASPASAQRNYEAGHYKDAYQEYARLLERKPDDPKLHYNAGAAAYQANKFEDAIKQFSASVTSPDLTLQHRSLYNLGNAQFRAGQESTDPAAKKEAWDQAVKQFESALKLQPNDADAAFNRDFVKKKLEELKQEQPQQQKSKDQKPQDQKDPSDQQDQQQQDQQKQPSQDQKSKPQQDQKKPEKSPDEKKDSQPPKDEQKSQEEQQQKKDRDKADQQKPKDEQAKKQEKESRPGESEKGSSDTNEMTSATAETRGTMTPEQVQQLLESQKANEKVMIFIPPDKAKGKKRVLRDW